ncbi:hypothetical protein [Ancylobacter oerskovii]|uniref:Alpha/beta hydrolase n=1 Tax=Ancylobacter oerskovii TaxID=459519 RepID=A0ABW4Z5E3_9HYPH|nr:hypothetical protein [Ancylobacter oerskovii]MBS7544302.1 hypothetical protein [Ancylobacter oerskovii]
MTESSANTPSGSPASPPFGEGVLRDFSRFDERPFVHNALDDLISMTSLESGVHTVNIQDGFFDFMYRRRKSRALLVFFHGAMRKEVTFPIFSGLGIGHSLRASRLLFSDMTLHVDRKMRLGWYLGKKNYCYSDDIVSIINWVVKTHGYRRIILVGGSGGGHAALKISRRIAKSIAFVWNPQNDIGKYYWPPVEKVSSVIFDNPDLYSVPDGDRAKFQTCLSDVYRGGSQDNFIVYLQNFSDTMHLEQHASSFYQSMVGVERNLEVGSYKMNNKAILIVGDWADGHVGPPRGAMTEILYALVERSANIADMFLNDSVTSIVNDSLSKASMFSEEIVK